MTEAVKTTDATPHAELARAHVKRQEAKSDLTLDIGFGLAALAVGVAATVFMPGLLATAGFIFAGIQAWDVIKDTTRLMSIDKGIKQLKEGKTDDLKKSAKSIKLLSNSLKGLGLFAAGGVLALAVSAIAAPALLPMATAVTLINTIVWPAIALVTASKVVEGVSKGQHDVIKAIDPPAPEAAKPKPAPAAAEKAPGPVKKLGASIMSVFKKKAAPAAAEAPKAPAPAPEIKPVAPAAPA